jgi:hypothetical protein
LGLSGTRASPDSLISLSHHLEKLKNEDLVKVRREWTFLWYSTNTEVLQELLGFFVMNLSRHRRRRTAFLLAAIVGVQPPCGA